MLDDKWRAILNDLFCLPLPLTLCPLSPSTCSTGVHVAQTRTHTHAHTKGDRQTDSQHRYPHNNNITDNYSTSNRIWFLKLIVYALLLLLLLLLLLTFLPNVSSS